MFLDIEPLLIARLRDQVPGVRGVFSAADLAGVTEEQQVTPAVHVVFAGYRVAAEAGHGGAAKIAQTWLTWVVVRNLTQGADGTAALRQDAAPIADAIIRACLGWRPSEDMGLLRITNAPQPSYAAGIMYLPIGWMVELTVRGE